MSLRLLIPRSHTCAFDITSVTSRTESGLHITSCTITIASTSNVQNVNARARVHGGTPRPSKGLECNAAGGGGGGQLRMYTATPNRYIAIQLAKYHHSSTTC